MTILRRPKVPFVSTFKLSLDSIAVVLLLLLLLFLLRFYEDKSATPFFLYFA